MNKIKYNKEIHPIITKALMSRGFTPAEVADAIGITSTEFSEWLMTYEELKESAIQGNIIMSEIVQVSLFKRITGYTIEEKSHGTNGDNYFENFREKHIPPDVKACIKWLEVHNPSKWKRQEPAQTKAIQQKSSFYCQTCGKTFLNINDYVKNHAGCDNPQAIEMSEGE